MELYKYQGAGNDFIIADNRSGNIKLDSTQIISLCDRRYGIGADGLMLLESADGYDFKMVYYNSDGSGGMMCGNGGRCIVAFADFCGLKSYDFIAADGPHQAQILQRNGRQAIVKLKMRDVEDIVFYNQDELVGCFLDTGTRHFVKRVDDIANYDVRANGPIIRHSAVFAPIGVNVNFIMPANDALHVRTFEKGVEDETFACGTGITAAAIAQWHMSHNLIDKANPKPIHTVIKALRDGLAVDFTPTPNGACDVWLTGPATYVAKIII